MDIRRGVKTGANPGGAIEAIAPPKTMAIAPTKSIVLSQKYCEVYFILKQWTRNETWQINITEIVPLTLLAGSASGPKRAFAPLWKLGLRTETF